MLKISFAQRDRAAFRILCLGAHSDDIEIGCGGTILKLLAEMADVEVRWVVFGASGPRTDEANASATRFLSTAKRKQVTVRDFRDGFFPYIGAEIKQYFEELKAEAAPDLILTHYRNDLHQDHRVISELTWNTFRNHLILEYEIVKYDGDMGVPNLFVQLSESVCRQKIANLLECFPSQRGKSWFSDETFSAMLRLRGVECNAPEKYAEAFYSRKLVC